MSIEPVTLRVGDLQVELVRKDIKNLHLGVYPPAGRVRIAAPLALNDDAIRLAVVRRLTWIRKQQKRFDAQPRQSAREMVNGESHYLFGRRYRLLIETATGRQSLIATPGGKMRLRCHPGADTAKRWRVLERHYRCELKAQLVPLIEHWSETLSLAPPDWRVRWMKTKWGSCATHSRRLWFNLALARVPVECIDYVVVHEMLHLIDATHGERFIQLLDKHLPEWRLRREQLNAQTL